MSVSNNTSYVSLIPAHVRLHISVYLYLYYFITKQLVLEIQMYRIHLSDLPPFFSFVVVLVVLVLRRIGILVRLLFSFPLSHSLSDVRSVSLLAFRTGITEWVDILELSPTGAWINFRNRNNTEGDKANTLQMLGWEQFWLIDGKRCTVN